VYTNQAILWAGPLEAHQLSVIWIKLVFHWLFLIGRVGGNEEWVLVLSIVVMIVEVMVMIMVMVVLVMVVMMGMVMMVEVVTVMIWRLWCL
jgi:hypothetical protein